MKTKRLISLLLAAVFALSAAATPALAASAGSELPDLTTAGVDENNSVVSIRLTADGDLTYGSPFTLSVQTTPADTQYIGVVMGTSGEAQGYVTLILSGKIRTLLKMIPLPKKMSANPEQEEEFNIYAYIKQLIDGNDVSVLLRVADEVVSVMDVLKFYIPTLKDVSTGMKLALNSVGSGQLQSGSDYLVAFTDRENPGQSIFKDADQALYQVKQNGRHGCGFY